MNNYNLKIEKVIAALPSTLTANTLYIVRAGAGVDLYVTDMTGSVAHKHNGVPQSVLDQITGNTTNITTLFNALKTMGEQNIWSVCDRTMTVPKGSANKIVYNSNDEFFRINISGFTSNENQITLSNCLVDTTSQTLINTEDYTLSFDLKALSNPGTFQVLTQLGSSTTNTSTAMTATTSWTPYEFTFKATGSGTTSTFSILINSTTGWSSSGGYDIRRVRLQKGTRGSGYNKSMPLVLNTLAAKLDTSIFTPFRTHMENTNTKLVALGSDTTQDTWICDYTKVVIDADASARGGYTTRVYNDYGTSIRTKALVAFDDKKLYKLTTRFKMINGAAGTLISVGVESLHRDKVLYITKANGTSSNIGSGSYLSFLTNNGPHAEYVVYFKGRGATSGSGTGTLNDPLILPAQTAWISPSLYVNSISTTQIYVDYMILEETDTFYAAGSGISITNGVISSTSQNATHTGEVTGDTALTITPGAVTFTKIQNIPTKTLIGRYNSGSGTPESVTLGSGLDVNASGVLNTTNNGTVTSVGMTVPTGLIVSGAPIVSSGTLAVTYGTGYQGFLTSDKNKLDGIAAGAEVNVNPDWNAVSGDAQILNKPTTISGYGITDGVSTGNTYDNPVWFNSLAWSKITGKPTTLSGYGITDAASSTHNHTLDSLSNVTVTSNTNGEILRWNGTSWINNTLSEAGIAASNQTMFIGTTGLSIGRTSAALSLTGVSIDGNAGTVTNGVYTTGSYSNPLWLSSIEWGKVTGLPTTLSGYGITDAVNTGNTYANPSWISSLAFSKITGLTTVGNNLATLTNPSAITFLRVNADNTVSALDASTFRTAIGAGTSSTTGTVTSVNLTAPTGFSVSGGPITTSGALALTYASGYQGFLTTDKTKLDGIEIGANNYVLPMATSTVAGGVGLFSNTVQTVAANSVTAAAARTYGVQLNSAGQAVVNVPWVDTDTNTTYTNGTGLGLSLGAFSVLYGTTAGTATEGNDSRVLNGQTAYTWGNHATAGYSLNTHNHTLDSLSNVTITSNSAGEILKWNGSAWINNTLAEAGIQAAGSYLTTTQRGVANGVASLDASGLIPTTQLPSYVDDVLEYINLAAFPATGETGKIYTALDTNKVYRWSGSAYIYITSGAVDSVAGKTGVVTLVKGDVGLGSVDNTADSTKNVLSATKLTTARTLSYTGDVTGSGSFDGSTNISTAMTLANSGVTAGSYGSTTTVSGFTVNAKGLITSTTTYTIPTASTTVSGLTTLNNTLTSTSTNQALTAAQGKILQDGKAPIADPVFTGTVTAPYLRAGNSTYPRLELVSSTATQYGAILENSPTGYPYFAVRDKNELGNSATQLAVFSLPTTKTGSHTLAMTSDITSIRGAGVTLDDYTVSYRDIAHLAVRAASVSGAIVIHLPKSKDATLTMMKMMVSGFNYSTTNGTWDIALTGYSYQTGGTRSWFNCNAVHMNGNTLINQVRFAQASDHQVIIIGKFDATDTLTSTFSYPRIHIKEFVAGYTAPTDWNRSDFTIAIETDLSPYTTQQTKTVGEVSGTTSTFSEGITGRDLSVALKGSSSEGYGLSLYGGVGSAVALPSYGMSFAGTASYGTHGPVTGNWATYFTMGGTDRGWIFKSNSTSSTGNVASISSTGVFTGSEFVGPLTGNASSATTASKLTTARTLNGISFDGSGNITIPVSNTGITASSDLDTYKTPGFYSCPMSATAAGLTNCPTTLAFSMLVERGAGSIQTLTEYPVSGQRRTFKRHEYNNVWGAWYEILTTLTGDNTKLPLTGGTLTGTLVGTSAEFTGSVETTGIKVDVAYGLPVTTTAGIAAPIKVGGLLVSNSYSDQTLVPTNGIYSKGTILTGAGSVSTSLSGLGVGNLSMFRTTNTNVGTTYGYVPLISIPVQSAAGYRQNISFGAYRPASDWTGAGVYIANGNNDSYPTEALTYTIGNNLNTVAGSLNFPGTVSFQGTVTTDNPITVTANNTVGSFTKLIQSATVTDGGYLAVGNTASDKGYVEVGTIDDSDTQILLRKRNSSNTVLATFVAMDSNHDTIAVGKVAAYKGFGVQNTSSSEGYGVGLYNGDPGSTTTLPSYGMAFTGTAAFGAHGAVGGGDWATYFTMSGPTTRGWIFKSGNTGTGGNVASISASGVVQADRYQLNTGYGANSYQGGTGDGATYATHNARIKAWWGLGLTDNADVCRIVFNTRSGNLDLTGTVTAGAFSGNASSATQLSTASGSAPSYSARAWVNFNGQGTVAIRSSGNVSSITDNGTGNYTVNFTTAMPHANYAATTAVDNQGTAGIQAAQTTGYTTSALTVNVRNAQNSAQIDNAYINVIVMC